MSQPKPDSIKADFHVHDDVDDSDDGDDTNNDNAADLHVHAKL